MSNVEEVGARMVLSNGAKFRADLAASTDTLKDFNAEQATAAKLSRSTSKAVADGQAVIADSLEEGDAARAASIKSMDAFNDTQVAMADVSKRSATAMAASSKASGAAVVAGATAIEKATKASTKILKYASVGLLAVGYEGIKNYNSFQQMISQTAIDAGIKKSQLPAFSQMAIQISNATGLAATSVADMMYRIASANPKIGTTTAAMKAMATQAANLYVLSGATGDYDSIARTYGAIVSNKMSLNGGKSLGYTNASAKAINEWVLATVGHGDMKTGDLVSALGSGILPVAQTYGLSLNNVGAALDVLSPAMNASAASTRLKTAIGMLGSPSQKTSQAMELIGGNGTTLSGLLRSKGLGGALSYLGGLESKTLNASTFIGGGIFGAASGKYSGAMGGADWLKAYGFTNPALVSLLQSQGAGGLKGLSSSQLQGLGFTKGLTGSQAAQTVVSDLIGQMFGGGHTGAAIMQLVNEQGTYQNKLSAINSSETPKSYAAAMKIAYAEPIVAFHKFEQQLKNFTITVGGDITPKFDDFLADLEKLGNWFGKNKWAIDSLLGLAGGIVGGAALIKGASLAAGVVRGGTSIVKAILNPGASLKSLFSGSSESQAAAIQLRAAQMQLEAAGGKVGADGSIASGSAKKSGLRGILGPAAAADAQFLAATAIAVQASKVPAIKHFGQVSTSSSTGKAYEAAYNVIDTMANIGSLGFWHPHLNTDYTTVTGQKTPATGQTNKSKWAMSVLGSSAAAKMPSSQVAALVSLVGGKNYGSALQADLDKLKKDGDSTSSEQHEAAQLQKQAAQLLQLAADGLIKLPATMQAALSAPNIHAAATAGLKTKAARQ